MSGWGSAPVLPVMDSALESGFHSASGSALVLDSALALLESVSGSGLAPEFDSAPDSQSEPALSSPELLPPYRLLPVADLACLALHLDQEQTNTSSQRLRPVLASTGFHSYVPVPRQSPVEPRALSKPSPPSVWYPPEAPPRCNHL